MLGKLVAGSWRLPVVRLSNRVSGESRMRWPNRFCKGFSLQIKKSSLRASWAMLCPRLLNIGCSVRLYIQLNNLTRPADNHGMQQRATNNRRDLATRFSTPDSEATSSKLGEHSLSLWVASYWARRSLNIYKATIFQSKD